MIKIIMSGCNGKMGQVITRLAAEMSDCQIVAGFDIAHSLKNSYPVFLNPLECNVKADVIIDFSHPNCLENLLTFATKNRIPVVVATTGLAEPQHQMMQAATKEIPIFFSANMSVGINLLIDLVQKATKILSETFDIEIIEKHHNQKIDAPSGTALAIADAIAGSMPEKPEYVYDRSTERVKRSKNEIGLHAIRGGTIVGEHSVIFAGQDEIIEVNHIAMSKEIFAAGAIKAAKYLAGKEAGMYNMHDLVNSQE
ncbi:MAG: 4-hydroxy-tetrahydrodipicolinate reductase [Hyphomonadaceae bacterium]|nr:4-hydroxy-tetrahydrodipicolinate reductase [Clostridia bacterium]